MRGCVAVLPGQRPICLVRFAGRVRGSRLGCQIQVRSPGEPRDRKYYQPRLARAGTWRVWWVLLMSLWVMLDGSLATDELLAGAGAAAIAALVAELATYQAETMVLHQLVTKGGD